MHLLVAAYLDYKPKGGAASSSHASGSAEADPAVVEAFMAFVPQMPPEMMPRIPNPYSRKRPPHGRH